jgi:tRNA nucleotidyltransferase (CCA-adding enzyme)
MGDAGTHMDVRAQTPPWIGIPAWSAGDGPGAEVLARLRELPGGPELLALAERWVDAEVELVGGAARDLLLGRDPRELDVVVGADAGALARELASATGGSVTVHERFGTALLVGGEGRVDIATRRAETYPTPGALPHVRIGTAVEDLQRRDFTVNAIALGLGGARRGQLREAPGALADLHHGRLRALHERSFRDDPTRLLRLARYGARLGFGAEPHTAQLARDALAAGALATVSGARLGAELRLALAEASGAAALQLLHEHGVLAAMHPLLCFDRALYERALGLLPDDGRPELLALAVLVLELVTAEGEKPSGARARGLLDRLEFPHGERDRAVAAALEAWPLRHALPRCECPAELYVALHREPVECVALAGALDPEREDAALLVACARRWLDELRHVSLRIGGQDLLAAGVPEGPELGSRLLATLLLRVNGQLADEREAQLRAALELPAGP